MKNKTLFSKEAEGKKGKKTFGGAIVNCLTQFTIIFVFLVTCMRLYDPLCPSVCRSVGPSVRPSHLAFFAAPAYPHATKVAVYSALFFFKFLCYSMGIMFFFSKFYQFSTLINGNACYSMRISHFFVISIIFHIILGVYEVEQHLISFPHGFL